MKLGAGGGARRDKGDAIRAQNRGVQGAADVLSSAPEAIGLLKHVALSEIEVDPDNPRSRKLTWEELTNPEAVKDPRKRASIDAIYETAESMKGGQLQAIQVYRSPVGTYVIIDGEGRYWGLRLIKSPHALCEILPRKPKDLERRRVLVNVMREAYDAVAILTSVEQHAEAFERERGRPLGSIEELQQELGLKRTRAYHWFTLLNADPEVKREIRGGRHSSIERAVQAARRGNQEAPAPSKRGRKRESLALGVLSNEKAARQLLRKLAPSVKWSEVPRGDWGALQNRWDDYIKSLSGSEG